jgi:hypothetical protein
MKYKTYEIVDCQEEEHYRWSLTVKTIARSTRSLVVVQCNPSYASSTRSDATVGKVSNWAADAGYATVTFLNLFARRSSKVAGIRDLSYRELVGKKNDNVLAELSGRRGATLVFAWGADLPVTPEQYARRLGKLRELVGGRRIHCVGALSKNRFPRHGRLWNHGNRNIRRLSWGELL